MVYPHEFFPFYLVLQVDMDGFQKFYLILLKPGFVLLLYLFYFIIFNGFYYHFLLDLWI